MSTGALKLINRAMQAMGLKYGFMEYTVGAGDPLPETYFTGEYQELEGDNEAGEEESIFLLTGFSREGWGVLEQAKERIRKCFPAGIGRLEDTDSGSAAVFYESSFPIPVEDEELKKIQINLKVKEWRTGA